MDKTLRAICLLLALALLAGGPACLPAAAEDGFGARVEAYMAEHALDEENFALAFSRTDTGETWLFNADRWMPAGSMYKLPLAMAVYDRLRDGTIERTQSVEELLCSAVVYPERRGPVPARPAQSLAGRVPGHPRVLLRAGHRRPAPQLLRGELLFRPLHAGQPCGL